MRLLTLNANIVEPMDYIVRLVVKAVIQNDRGLVLLTSSGLIGGGVDIGETNEGTLHREAMEEAGVRIEIIKPLGEVVQYRDVLKKKYITQGYLCKYLETAGAPTTTDADELNMKNIWENPQEAIQRIQAEIKELKEKNHSNYEGDTYQSKLYNRETAVAFLKVAFS